MELLPIYNWRTIIGYAKNEKHAEKIIRSKLQNIPKGWQVSVHVRITEINDMPHGFVYSIHP